MRWMFALALALALAACGGAPDGGSCNDDGDCALGHCGRGAGICTDGVCDGLDDPNCPGPERECVARDGVIFSADDLCLLRCVEGTCPDLFWCDGGVHCTYSGIRVQIDPAQPLAGMPVTLSAELVGEPGIDYSWIFFDGGAGRTVLGQVTTQTFSRGTVRVVAFVVVPVGEQGTEAREHELAITID